MSIAGFTLNVIVLFALTLAIGLLFDDAIVVENVEGLDPILKFITALLPSD